MLQMVLAPHARGAICIKSHPARRHAPQADLRARWPDVSQHSTPAPARHHPARQDGAQCSRVLPHSRSRCCLNKTPTGGTGLSLLAVHPLLCHRLLASRLLAS